MVKKRTPKSVSEKVEEFAAAADGGKQPLNPNAKRDFKAISVPFNEYEYSQLEDLAERTGRSKLNLIRWAISELSKEN